jgi:hypothetical protein
MLASAWIRRPAMIAPARHARVDPPCARRPAMIASARHDRVDASMGVAFGLGGIDRR